MMKRKWSAEQKAAAADRMRERWANKKGPSPTQAPPAAPTPKQKRTMSPEQKLIASHRMKERWEISKNLGTSPPNARLENLEPFNATYNKRTNMTDDITARTRAESSQRLHQLLESSKLQPGEVNPVPPDPPANYGRLPEAGKGGAISQGEREVGVDPVKIITPEKPKLPDNHHPLAPDVVTRRGESLTEPIIPIREDIAPLVQDTEPPSEEDGTILRIPDWNAIPLDDAEAWLEMLRTEETRGAEIINRRHGENSPINYCANPACHKPVPDGKEAFSKTVQDPVTKIYHRLVLCTARCWTIWQKGPGVPRSNPPGANLSSRDR